MPTGQQIRVGAVSIQPVFDGTAVLDTTLFDGADFTDHQHLLADDGRLHVPVGAFLVRTGDRTVLLDAGVGDVHDEMFDGGELLDDLSRHGVTVDEIDTIVISHLHSDHCGWLDRDGGPTFPNATVHIGAADWQYFVVDARGGKRRAERLRTLEDHVQLVDGDGSSIAPGITMRSTPGHTPGHVSAVISSGQERMIVLGDALHCPAQLTNAEWQFFYDVDRELAVRTRQQLLRDAEEPGTSVLPCHFPGMQAARLVPATGERRWVLG